MKDDDKNKKKKLVVKTKKEETNTKLPEGHHFSKAWELKRSLIPSDNTFNVVSIDKHEMPGQELYFVGNYDSQAEAHTKQKEQERQGIRTFIYDKDTK